MKKIFLVVAVLGTAAFFLFTNKNNNQSKKTNSKISQSKNTKTKKIEEHDHGHGHGHDHSHGENEEDKIAKSKMVTIDPNGNVRASDTHDHGGGDTPDAEAYIVEKVSIPDNPAGESLKTFSTLLRKHTLKDFKISELKEDLKAAGLKIISSIDKNPVTGSIKMIRTKNTIPGTRYFHAQIFENQEGEDFIQHISYEYKPGDKSFEEVIAATKLKYKLGKANVRKDGFYSWNINDGYVVWIKRLEASDIEDLKHDPFNAYSIKDIGTIRVAIELDPHQ
jgi:hypothetical protein